MSKNLSNTLLNQIPGISHDILNVLNKTNNTNQQQNSTTTQLWSRKELSESYFKKSVFGKMNGRNLTHKVDKLGFKFNLKHIRILVIKKKNQIETGLFLELPLGLFRAFKGAELLLAPL